MRRAIHALAFALAVAALPASTRAEVVTLNPQVVVTGEVVRLGDVFIGAGDKAEAAVAHAPPLGRRIVLDAYYLTRLARAHGLRWQAISRLDRAVIERDSRSVPAGAVGEALELALAEAGAPGRRSVELDGAGPSLLVPADAEPSVAVRDLRYDATSGRFTAQIAAPADAPVGTQSVSGRVHEMVLLPVPARAIAKGEVIRSADLSWLDARTARLPPDAALDATSVVGMAARRTLRADEPLRLSDVERPLLVTKGSLVTMRLVTPYMTLTARGRAVDNGAHGDIIRVMNVHSRKIVEAAVETAELVVVPQPASLAIN